MRNVAFLGSINLPENGKSLKWGDKEKKNEKNLIQNWRLVGWFKRRRYCAMPIHIDFLKTF